jgi:pimeloyl-ACP methyl ester carboxylesterase
MTSAVTAITRKLTLTLTLTLTVPGIGQVEVEVEVEDRGQGRPFLLLHGGAGPQSMAGFAALLAEREPARVLTPVHPGFAGTPRPGALSTPAGLAAVYRALLDELGLDDVTVIGGSIGGWIAAELALLDSPRVSGIVLVGAVGIGVPGHPVTDVSALSLPEVMALSYHNPAPFIPDLAAFTGQQVAAMAANRAALALYAPTSSDPTLLGRLNDIKIPTLVISGESDRIASPDYGRAYAEAIHCARYILLPGTGHMPMIETPELLLTTIQNARDRSQEAWGDKPGGPARVDILTRPAAVA